MRRRVAVVDASGSIASIQTADGDPPCPPEGGCVVDNPPPPDLAGRATWDANAQIWRYREKDYAESRREEYPQLGDQLGAITDALRSLRDAGEPLPETVLTLLDQIQAVKTKYPKGSPS